MQPTTFEDEVANSAERYNKKKKKLVDKLQSTDKTPQNSPNLGRILVQETQPRTPVSLMYIMCLIVFNATVIIFMYKIQHYFFFTLEIIQIFIAASCIHYETYQIFNKKNDNKLSFIIICLGTVVPINMFILQIDINTPIRLMIPDTPPSMREKLEQLKAKDSGLYVLIN